MMQTHLTPPESMQKGSNASNSSEDDPIPLDWMIDLQRIVQQHVDQCQADPQTEFLFSVYTWFLDHNSQKVCREPKIATLGGDPTEWEEDILQPWQQRLDRQEHVYIDLVQPAVPRSSIEEHLAHIILTQHPEDLSSVLFSMELVDDQAVSVIVRTAVMVPRNCQQLDIVRMVSLFESFSQNQIAWKFPELSSSDQTFRTWSGMGLKVDIYADNEHNMAEETSLFQVCSLSNRRDVLHQFDLNSRQPCTQPSRSCIKTCQSSISRSVSSPKFTNRVDMLMIRDDYSFAKEFSIRHCDLLDWTDKPWQLWMKDNQDRWFRRAPPSEKAVLSCGQPLPDCTITPPIQVARITDHHGRPECLAPELTPAGPNDQDNAQEAQRIPIPTFLQHLLEMAPVEDEWNDDLAMDFLFVHGLSTISIIKNVKGLV
jgi:hypothetical protein